MKSYCPIRIKYVAKRINIFNTTESAIAKTSTHTNTQSILIKSDKMIITSQKSIHFGRMLWVLMKKKNDTKKSKNQIKFEYLKLS